MIFTEGVYKQRQPHPLTYLELEFVEGMAIDDV